jgi:hypothetical protein
VAHVVSYGRNGFPGGDSTKSDQMGSTDNDPLKVAAMSHRLYEESSRKVDFDFLALTPSTTGSIPTTAMPGVYDLPRLQALHQNYTYTDATGTHTVGWPALFPSGTANSWYYLAAPYAHVPGILDPGSDDIVFQIP